jgi:hypothetical protein
MAQLQYVGGGLFVAGSSLDDRLLQLAEIGSPVVVVAAALDTRVVPFLVLLKFLVLEFELQVELFTNGVVHELHVHVTTRRDNDAIVNDPDHGHSALDKNVYGLFNGLGLTVL